MFLKVDIYIKEIFPNASLRDFIYFSDIHVDINHF